MGIVIAVANHKGGVAKTTSVLNFGVGLAKAGKRVLLIDIDSQANLTTSMGLTGEEEYSIYNVLREEIPLKQAAVPKGTNLDIVPSCLELSRAELELSNKMAREAILRHALEPLVDEYDFVLIDCPPSLGILTLNALVACDEVIIPIHTHYLAVRGVPTLLDVVEEIRKKRLNPKIRIGGIVVTMYDQREAMQKQILESIRQKFGDTVFETIIRKNVALSDAPIYGEDVYTYDGRSKGAEDYSKLTTEFLRRYQ